jgi:hypothetical protein
MAKVGLRAGPRRTWSGAPRQSAASISKGDNMFKVSDFKIGADDKWWYIFDQDGDVVKKFNSTKYSKDQVRLWREGYVKGLNDVTDS